jgi:hypothetical protein
VSSTIHGSARSDSATPAGTAETTMDYPRATGRKRPIGALEAGSLARPPRLRKLHRYIEPI